MSAPGTWSATDPPPARPAATVSQRLEVATARKVLGRLAESMTDDEAVERYRTQQRRGQSA